MTYSKEFIDKWKQLLINIYGYDTYMDFIIMPSILGKKTLSYLPFLNYTDRTSLDIKDLLELSKDNKFLIKCLDINYEDFKENDTVSMMLDISSHNLEYVSKNKFHYKCRNQIKKSHKSGLNIKINSGIDIIMDFYILYKKNMQYHGTPIFSLDFFILLNKTFECDFLVVYKDEVLVSSMVAVYDKNISSNLWAGIDNKYFKYCPNHYMYNAAIDIAIQKNKNIFDFGRSPYGGATYKFKKQWGAKPIKIDTISSSNENIYSKYSLASNVWKKIPTKITDFIGPKLCKYLVDL